MIFQIPLHSICSQFHLQQYIFQSFAHHLLFGHIYLFLYFTFSLLPSVDHSQTVRGSATHNRSIAWNVYFCFLLHCQVGQNKFFQYRRVKNWQIKLNSTNNIIGMKINSHILKFSHSFYFSSFLYFFLVKFIVQVTVQL